MSIDRMNFELQNYPSSKPADNAPVHAAVQPGAVPPLRLRMAGLASFSCFVQGFIVATALLLAVPPAYAEDNKPSPQIAAGTVVELFTSHGCSSCPSADKLFGSLVEIHPDLVALEYHVTYWDTLVHGSAGSFKDPFSNKDYTLRQHTYNSRELSGRAGVYTPQMIVNGEYATVGSQERFVNRALQTAQPRKLQLETLIDGGELQVRVSGDLTRESRIWLVVFDIEKTTEITGGENKDLSLVNHHIVRRVQDLGGIKDGQVDDGALLLTAVPELADGQGCAVIVQGRVPGQIQGAANCPRSAWKTQG